MSFKLSRQKQCKAITDSTGKQCTRSFNTWLGRRYCWQHMPKQGFVLSNLMSAVFGLILSLIWSYSTTSEESTQIKNAVESIIDNQINRSLLSNEIDNLTLVLDLNDSLAPDDYFNDGILIRMSNPVNRFGLETLTTILESGNSQQSHWFFQGQSSVYKDGKVYVERQNGAGSYNHNAKSIPINISLENSKIKPFTKIIELDEYELEIFLPKSMASKVNQIRLLANSGYQYRRHILIMSHNVNETSWVDTDYELSNNYKYKLRSSNEHSRSAAKWRIKKDDFKEIVVEEVMSNWIIMSY